MVFLALFCGHLPVCSPLSLTNPFRSRTRFVRVLIRFPDPIAPTRPPAQIEMAPNETWLDVAREVGIPVSCAQASPIVFREGVIQICVCLANFGCSFVFSLLLCVFGVGFEPLLLLCCGESEQDPDPIFVFPSAFFSTRYRQPTSKALFQGVMRCGVCVEP